MRKEHQIIDRGVPINRSGGFKHVDAGLDEITKTLDHYNLLAVPVVDSENRIQGVITIDDIMQAVMPRTWRRRLSRMLG